MFKKEENWILWLGWGACQPETKVFGVPSEMALLLWRFLVHDIDCPQPGASSTETQQEDSSLHELGKEEEPTRWKGDGEAEMVESIKMIRVYSLCKLK